MTSMTIHLMTILSILIAPLSAYGSAIRHSGRSHPHPKVQAHQEAEGNGSGVGLYELVPPPIVPEPVSSSTHTPDVTFQDSILPVNIPMSTGMEDQPTPTNIPTISHYAFPTTVIQIAVASNCPDTPSSSAIFPLLSTDLASYNATNTMETSSPTITNYVPVYVNATAFLPNGSSTVFLSLSSPTATTTLEPTELPSADTARIVQDSNGCQTVYTAATITVCSTTIRPPGMLAVPVTDCDQWITFSSQKLGGDCSSTDYTVLQTVKSPTLGPLAGPLSPSPTPSPRITGPVVFYAAHWYELVEHPVPRLVRVENCLHDMGISSICQTSSEAWNVVYNTRIITTSSVASFSGPAILTSSIRTFTTYLAFSTTVTTYTTITSSSISRAPIPTETFSSAPQEIATVIVVVSTPTTRTWLLEEVTKSDSTAMATVTIFETTTVQVTETKTRTISTRTTTAETEDVVTRL